MTQTVGGVRTDRDGPRDAEPLFGLMFGRTNSPRRAAHGPYPLIIALHGGTYSSAYFDLPGYSLLDTAEALDLPVLAIDRPGYGGCPPLPAGENTLRGNADFLAKALRTAWDEHGGAARGVFLIGHSIGAGIAMMIAAQALDWPLLGLAISGVGLRTPDQSRDAWAALPNTPFIELPAVIKDEVMFGPQGSFGPDMPAASHAADAPVPRTEILDIVTTWRHDVADVASRIKAPLHYRQAEHDRLWIVDEGEVRDFAAALSASARVDAAMLRNTGHCIDYHTLGLSLQVQQLGFAMQCAVQHG